MLTKAARGIWCAMVTPLDEQENIDREAAVRLTDHITAGGCDGLLLLGSTGEQIALDSHEKAVMVKTVRDHNPDIPLMVGCGATSTRLAVANVHAAEEAGADAVIVTPPCFYPFGAKELYEYYHQISLASHVPVYLYNISRFVGTKIPVETVRMLLDDPNVMGIKESDRDLPYVKELLEVSAEREDFAVIQGSERVFVESFDMGCPAGVTVVGNVAPRLSVDLYRAWKAGDRAEADRLQALELRYVSAVTMLGRFPKEIKIGCSALGLCSDKMTSPFPDVGEEDRQRVIAALAELKAE